MAAEVNKTTSNFFRRNIGASICLIKDLYYSDKISNLPKGDYFSQKSPIYVSQIANADKDKIEGFYGKISDQDAAKRYGTIDQDKFSYWAWRSCAIACVQMAIASYESGREVTTMELVDECVQMGGYDHNNDRGWYHQSIAELINRHGLKSEAIRFAPLSQLVHLISQGYVILASVLGENSGHFLYVYGFKISSKKNVEGFWFQDPNNYSRDGRSQYIGANEFEKKFTNRLISVKK